MRSRNTWGLLPGAILALGMVHCSQPDEVSLASQLQSQAVTGQARLALTLGELEIDTVSAVLSRDGDVLQTQSIDVSGGEGVIAVYFGELPVGSGYAIELSAGACSGAAEFEIAADATTLVEVTLECAGSERTGSAQVTGAFEEGSAPACDLVKSILAVPSIQFGDVPTRLELVLQEGVEPTDVEWSVSLESDAKGQFVASGKGALHRTLDCTTDGRLEVVASVTALRDGGPCTDEARATVQCVEQFASAPAAEVEPPPPAAEVEPPPTAEVEPPAPPPDPVSEPAEPGACGRCALDNCAEQLAVVTARSSAVAPVIECVLGADWSAGERAPAESCGNLDLFNCYCGSVPGAVCASSPTTGVDGACSTEILAATGCADSSCVQSRLLEPANPAGQALAYVRCQQDFCYDFCFNL